MKSILKLFTVLATLTLFAAGCVNEDPAYKGEPGVEPTDDTGLLALNEMSMRVVLDTQTDVQPDETGETRSAATRATPNINDFIIEIFDADEVSVFKKTYAQLQAITEPIALAVGTYNLTVRSEESMPDVDWEHPYYGASRAISILKAQTTPISEVVCTLQNIKVTVGYPTELADMLSAETKAIVSLGSVSQNFIKGETRAAYFKPQAEENTLDFAIEGTYADTGEEVSMSNTITGVKAGQWRKITVKIASASQGKIKFRIDVDNLMQEDNINVNSTESLWEPIIEENTGMPTIAWAGHDLTQPYQLKDNMFDANGKYIGSLSIDFTSPNGIRALNVDINSTSSKFLSSLSSIQIPTSFDVCTINPSAAAGIILKGFGFPVGSEVYDRSECSFDIAGQMPLLYECDGTHTFAFSVKDANGRSASASLVIVVDKGGAAAGPTIVWRNYDIDQRYEVVSGMLIDIDIAAASGIKTFIVTIDSEQLTPLLPDIGIPTTFDICNLDDELADILRDELGFPVNAQVKNQTYVEFSITAFVDLLVDIYGTHDFKLDVTDNDGNTTTKTVKLITKED